MNFCYIAMTLLCIAGSAWGASNCDSTKGSQAFNACVIQSLSSDFQSTKVDNGQWVYSLHPNTKTKKHSAFVATLLSSSKIHYLDEPVAMTIRCNNKKTELEIHWNGVELKEGRTDITYHVDQEEAQSAYWPLSIAQQSIYVSGSGKFIQRLATKETFRVQISSPSTPTINATFYLKGLNNLLPDMEGVCF